MLFRGAFAIYPRPSSDLQNLDEPSHGIDRKDLASSRRGCICMMRMGGSPLECTNPGVGRGSQTITGSGYLISFTLPVYVSAKCRLSRTSTTHTYSPVGQAAPLLFTRPLHGIVASLVSYIRPPLVS